MDTDGDAPGGGDPGEDPESNSSYDGRPPPIDTINQISFFTDLLSKLPAPKFECLPVDVVTQSGGHLGTAMQRFAAHFDSLPPWDEVSLYRNYPSFLERSAEQSTPLAPITEESVCILIT